LHAFIQPPGHAHVPSVRVVALLPFCHRYCDGTHKKVNEKEGTSFVPVKYTATETKDV
jgi:hypothetical protein